MTIDRENIMFHIPKKTIINKIIKIIHTHINIKIKKTDAEFLQRVI